MKDAIILALLSAIVVLVARGGPHEQGVIQDTTLVRPAQAITNHGGEGPGSMRAAPCITLEPFPRMAPLEDA